jgi:hypothetical protein
MAKSQPWGGAFFFPDDGFDPPAAIVALFLLRGDRPRL